MKKYLLLCVALLSVSWVMADNDKAIRFEQLPQAAQTLIKQHFSASAVSKVKEETDWRSTSYEVQFTNGDKIEFDHSGQWHEISCRDTAVPAALVPPSIQQYVNENYPSERIVRIEKDANDYEVKLSSKREIKFDLNFKVLKVKKD